MKKETCTLLNLSDRITAYAYHEESIDFGLICRFFRTKRHLINMLKLGLVISRTNFVFIKAFFVFFLRTNKKTLGQENVFRSRYPRSTSKGIFTYVVKYLCACVHAIDGKYYLRIRSTLTVGNACAKDSRRCCVVRCGYFISTI